MNQSLNINDINSFAYLSIVATLILVGGILVTMFSHFFAKFFLINLINKIFGKKPGLQKILYKNHVYHRIAYLIPAIILYNCAYLFNIETTHIKLYFANLIQILTSVYIMIDIALILSALLNCVNDRYRNYAIAKQKPIKSYLQVIKLIIFLLTGILVVSVIFDKSPAYIFTGVGAATAIILLIFKDSIMGFVASIQLAAYDMVRIGDWIEMPNFGADGEVIDISLNTVKVQNFDKTIVTIPSYALLTTGLKNWRGMQEAGGRRVKQAILIDITTIKIIDTTHLHQLNELSIFREHVAKKITKQNMVTNIGLFRWYAESFLRQHDNVHKSMKLLIRQLQGTPTGLPVELCFFTTEINSEKHEAIQAEIFDHLYAILPKFGLCIYQSR